MSSTYSTYKSSLPTTKNNDSVVAKDAAMLESIDLTSTMDLHRSNLMRMQVNELLEECKLDIKGRVWTTHAHEFLQDLTKIISQGAKQIFKSTSDHSIKDRADKVVHIEKIQSSSSLSKKLKQNNILSVEPIGCTKSQFGWTKKSGNAQMLPTFSLMVKLSSELFSSKDYLSYRYFDKRNYIMNKIAIYLSKHTDKLGRVEYKWSKGLNRSPYLQIVPKSNLSSMTTGTKMKKGGAKFQVHLHFGMVSIDWIPKLRLVPNRCNIKNDDDEHEHEHEHGDSALCKLTIQNQLYNHSLLFDARHQFEDDHLTSEDLIDNPNVEATLVLIQIWALQRGLWRNHDGWSKDNVTIFLLYLLRTNRMNPRMTPIQQFTVVLQMWSTTNWLGGSSTSKSKNENVPELRASQSESTQFLKEQSSSSKKRRRRRDVLVLPLEECSEKETIRKSDLGQLYEKQTKESPLTNNDPSTLIEAYANLDHYSLGPVMLDPTMAYNYLGDVSPNHMKLLQFHATKGLEGLKVSKTSFAYTFMKNCRFWNQWDMYVKIPVKNSSSSKDEWESSVRCLVGKLELALGNRIRRIRVMSTGNGDLSLEKNEPEQIPSAVVDKNSTYKRPIYLPPSQRAETILGIAINTETSQRLVDRGPPSDHIQEVKSFIKLWGEKAQLRRFKDGAIVQAVVWNDDEGESRYQNQVKFQGGFVQKILRHIVRLHHTKEQIEFSLPNLISVVDGISSKQQSSTQLADPLLAHQHVMKAFDSLSTFLRQSTQPLQYRQQNQISLEIPLAIDAVEPLSPCLRYSELFPPTPHPSLGGPSSSVKKISGAIMSDPVLIQIRFGASSKWPSDLKAIGAAKTAMLIQLANAIEGIDNNKDFGGPLQVTPNYLDLGYRGYCFRILVRADPEIKMLKGLVQPSSVASSLLQKLTKVHTIGAKHHSMLHAVHTLHPSSAGVARMAKRWIANHMLSGLIPIEAIELMVAKVYSDDETPLETPSTVTTGFLRFLYLLAHHDWFSEPLIVDPRGHITDNDWDEINLQFEKARGKNREGGHPMYIVAPYDKQEIDEDDSIDRNAVKSSRQSSWQPSTSSSEWVCLTRTVALATRSHCFMMKRLMSFSKSKDWSAIFHESPSSFQSYSVLLRVDTDFVVDRDASSTGCDLNPSPNEDGVLETSFSRSMKARVEGPKGLRRKVYRNIQNSTSNETILHWQPVKSVISSLRVKFGRYAIFFYNEFAPEVIGIVWRPKTFSTMPFSAMTAECVRPLEIDEKKWKNDSLVIRNPADLLREMSEYYQYVVTTVKIIDDSCYQPSPKRLKLSSSTEEY